MPTPHQQTADLIAWLRARLDADEQAALAAKEDAEVWQSASTGSYQPAGRVRAVGDDDAWTVGDVSTMAQADHIAIWHPARVLAEVAALRAVLDLRDAAAAGVEAADGTMLAGATRVRLGAYDNAIRLLAVPYADRAGYREQWRPQ